MEKHTPEFIQPELPYPKLCECGCGNPAPIAKLTDKRKGYIKGQPVRFIYGHRARLNPVRPLADRFWEKVDRHGPDDCWEWTASRSPQGYGRMGHGRKTKKLDLERFAHRISYQLHHGPIPNGLDVLHKCDNPPCVNPNHLFLGTDQDNVDDCIKKGRKNRVFGTKNPNVRLNEFQVIAIRQLAKERVPYIEISQRFDISISSIEKIVARKLWKHI